MNPDIFKLLIRIGPMIAGVVGIGVAGWVFTTWLRIKHGYPLDGAWGQAIYPKKNEETRERVKQLSRENAQLPPSSARSRTVSQPSSGSSPMTATA